MLCIFLNQLTLYYPRGIIFRTNFYGSVAKYTNKKIADK